MRLGALDQPLDAFAALLALGFRLRAVCVQSQFGLVSDSELCAVDHIEVESVVFASLTALAVRVIFVNVAVQVVQVVAFVEHAFQHDIGDRTELRQLVGVELQILRRRLCRLGITFRPSRHGNVEDLVGFLLGLARWSFLRLLGRQRGCFRGFLDCRLRSWRDFFCFCFCC